MENIKKRLAEFNITDYNIDASGIIDVYQDVKINNVIKSLGVNFGNIYGNFTVKNLQLDTFDGFPHTVDGSFSIYYSKLPNTLIGTPLKVDNDYNIIQSNVTTLEGIAPVINGNLILGGNLIESLVFLPKVKSGFVNLYNNRLIISEENFNIIYANIEPYSHGESELSPVLDVIFRKEYLEWFNIKKRSDIINCILR